MSAPTVSKKSYILIWVVLMVLLLLTWGVAQLNLGIANTIMAMIIAVIKMALVILFFMHVRYQHRLTWVFAGAGFVWLLIMITLTMNDYLTRGLVRPSNKIISYWESGTLPVPPGSQPGSVDPQAVTEAAREGVNSRKDAKAQSKP